MDGGVDIGGAGVEAGAHHRHVEEGSADIDDDLGVGRLDQRLGGLDVHGVERVAGQHAVPFMRSSR
jgi:hypothetical protein